MFSKRPHAHKKSEDVKKSAGKVVDPKRDTPTRAKHLRLFLDHAELHEIVPFFEAYYSHIFYIVYDAFITAEINLRQKGAHKAQREELEAVLYLFEKILIYLPEHLGRKWQYHSVGRLMSKLLHPGNSWKLLKREAMRLFLLWYQILGDSAGEALHAMFATLVPGFPSPYQGMGLTALAALTPDTQDGPINPAEICPLIPPQSGERWRSPDTDLTRIFLDVLLELTVSQVSLVEWKGPGKHERQKRCLDFLFDKFKTFYMPHIFPDFSWTMSLYRPALELPEVRKFRPAFVDTGDGTKKMDPMLSCRVVVVKWVAQYTHQTLSSGGLDVSASSATLAMNAVPTSYDATDGGGNMSQEKDLNLSLQGDELNGRNGQGGGNSAEAGMVREILYGNRDNVNFVHEVYRQAFLLSFSHSPAIKKVISVYKDWIQMNVPELPPFLLEPLHVDKEREDFMNAMSGRGPSPGSGSDSPDGSSGGGGGGGGYRLRNDSYLGAIHKDHLAVRAGLQNMLQIFITNAANVFLLEVSSEYPILVEEQVDMCKRVLNIYRYMVMNVKMEPRTWEQLLFILLQITQLTLPESPPRRREDTLGGRLAQAIFQTLIVTWIKANLYVVVSTELWDQFLEVLSSLTLWEELIREWAKTMETLTRVLARQVYHLDLNDLPLDRLSERAAKKRRGRQAPQETKYSSAVKMETTSTSATSTSLTAASGGGGGGHGQGLEDSSGAGSSIVTPTQRRAGSPYPGRRRKRLTSETDHKARSGLHRLRQKANLNRSLSEGDILGKFADGAAADPSEGGGGGHHWAAVHRRRHRSADDSLYNFNSDSGGSRSCSPAPSSGLECTSIKDSPMQLDHDTISESGLSADGGHGHAAHHAASSAGHALSLDSSSQHEQPRSVMSGGSVKGWLPDVAVVLWRRMLGALGNINHIADTVIHAQIYKYLIELFDIMVKIRNNQGVSLDNLSTPPPPDFVPPFTIFAPWCFRALTLPDTYHRGKMYALRLLCLFTCRQHDSPLPKTHLVQFYKVLHDGLTGQKADATNTLVKFVGPRFFSLMLPGHTAYVLDFLYAANSIISSSDLKGVPRTEATSVVGALLAFPSILHDVPLLLPNSNELSLISSADVKDQIIGVLLKSGKKEPAGLARCISLSSLGIFVYSELLHESFHPKIKEAIQVLLTALRFNNKAVAQIASDMLLLLADHVKNFLDYYPEVPKKIVEVLARTLISLTPRGDAGVGEDEKRLLLSLLLCLGEWCMRIPNYVLTQPQEDGRSLLYHVFGALQSAAEPGVGTPSPCGPGEQQQPRREGRQFDAFPPSARQAYAEMAKTVLSPAVMVADFDPNIHVDNTKEGYLSNNPSPQKLPLGSAAQATAPSHDAAASKRLTLNVPCDGDASTPTRLAARTVLSHLVNHLFHFPMGVGASSLSSMVSEHDDLPRLNNMTDELSMDVFRADNIQFFILNDTTLISFVELPALELTPGSPALKTAASQVRVILRDISGKFSWDSTALYGPATREDAAANEDLNRLLASPSSSLSSSLSASAKRSQQAKTTRQTTRQRSENVLPLASNTADDMDNLDDLLQYLGHTSPECLEEVGRPLNALPSASFFDNDAEQAGITGVLNQRNSEQEQGQKKATSQQDAANEDEPPSSLASDKGSSSSSVFLQCRRLFSQLGLASWEQRPNIHLLQKNERLLRELKNLDSKRCREAHKIAVIFVAEGQEDKHSILSNGSGSQDYEEFVSGLAWEVELETHPGFMGGLQKTKTTGETSPYYATSFVEVMFHVSTRMPSSSEESMLQKTRHLGNDEIHIVWSEHWRDYRRGILPTEFCDVLIVIYPLRNRLYRVQVSRKPEVPYFGPLFNEMIVDRRVLPGLVRATAINASRAKRSMLTYYQTHYEERFRALESIVGSHKSAATFEDFVTQVYSPAPLANLFQYSSSASSMSASSGRPTSLLASASMGSSVSSQAVPNILLESASSASGGGGFGGFFSGSHGEMRPRVASASSSVSTAATPLTTPTSSGPAHLLANHHGFNSGGNVQTESDDGQSPRQSRTHLGFKSSPGGGRDGAAAASGSSASSSHRRPLSIREEPGLPGEASPPAVPTRKR